MYDLNKQKIDITCDCGRKIRVTMGQVSLQATVSCSCGKKIKLVDKGRSTARGIREINRGFRDLEGTLKKLGKVKIKF